MEEGEEGCIFLSDEDTPDVSKKKKKVAREALVFEGTHLGPNTEALFSQLHARRLNGKGIISSAHMTRSAIIVTVSKGPPSSS